MKKSRILIIALTVCIIALGAGALLVFGNSIGLTYANADKYTAGSTTVTEKVEALDVNWISGNITVEYCSGNGIRVSETGNRTISGDDQLRWWLDGTTLRIQYAKSGRFRLFDRLEKTLTISLPEGTVLKNARIHTTSGDLNIPALDAEETELDTTSGNIRAGAATRKMKAGSTSGNLDIRVTGEAEDVRISVTSGDISLEAEDAKNISVKSTSGSVSVSGRAGDADISSTSGAVDVRFSAFEHLKIDVTSGNVKAALPEEPGFTAEISMTSGSFESDIAMAKSGKTYTCGDGSAKCEIHATSGNVRIVKAD